MSNLNNLTSKILKDAEDKKAVILNDAEEERNKILSKKVGEANIEEKTILERAEREAASRKERIISGAELHARNEKLEAKQKVIKEVFETSVKELSNCSADDLKGFIKEVILNSNIEGTQNLILNEVGKKAINEAFVAEINTALGNKANIKLSDETGKFKGGFILEQNGIEINNTFEALVSSLKDDLSLEVARVLFS
ncbi:V-type ATP synthase subunit E [Clostridium sp. SM-530-WT-3G]|uniref:V-type ATP synthase subunit E n=1 Tax=Clostridium sp. SM-530-WT-3G TaxID=2725303 RepID=UPI00145DF40C|nr:V-type ATP synthase subunit E [Clostridium sp. SM-530-WT-3G]NME82739.1 V-type ATP synthase subunit E [Clostridium sp. SM-530-WT-3G]